MEFEGQVALVTGAGRGIGRATVVRLAEAGCDIALNYHSSKSQAEEVAERITALGRKVELFPGDISRPETGRQLVDAVHQKFDRIDILVNNAGMARDKLLLAMEADDIHQVIATNLVGPMFLTQAVALTMLRRRRGRIVNITSAAASKPGKGQANYAASKGGLEAFTKAMAVELGSRGILVNAVAPGIVKTDLTEVLRDGAQPELLARQVIGSFAEPEAVAEAVAYLASPRNTHTTGTVLTVDGGLKMV
ncbi:3-oxoacyl-ACP reductase family protein [Streptomyces lancefieldiae]|uniref:3-oxoacyl-ACP reductase family protein n=1 Tax=Streptomyces lancefieldiae TaxID=3075520 RepID=A0ABU3AV82_9ACTN|nr:3-oxoacyl-ACP reductase family protein [Streptomyces sp. DSM 40712]MDT0614111.1 3-oxoacyl-ACP reductase family protein [Streptomyces sp. DSM 40712]